MLSFKSVGLLSSSCGEVAYAVYLDIAVNLRGLHEEYPYKVWADGHRRPVLQR